MTFIRTDGTCLEVERDQGENKCFEILHKVVEDTEALRVLRPRYVGERTDLGGLERC